MSKPPHKKEEDAGSSGSDTESESEEDEDTVSLLTLLCNREEHCLTVEFFRG